MGAPSQCGHCGVCPRCERAAHMREWYRRPGNAQSQRASARASRQRRLEAVRAYDRERGNRNAPEQLEAYRLVRKAIRAGTLAPQPCESCGETKVDAHHADYSRPLDVRWLCRVHHSQLHRLVA